MTANLASEDLRYGLAHIFDSGAISVSTQGAPGPTSTVTSSTSIAGCTTAVSGGCNAGQIYAGPFTATGVSSTCRADGSTNPAGSVTITAGQLAEEPTGGGSGGTPGPPIAVPTNPTPNYTVTAGAFNANSKLSAPQGATPGPAVVTVLNPPSLGNKAFDFRVNVTMNLGSLQIRLFHDFLVVFKGGTVIRMWFLNPGSGFPPSFEQTLVQDVVSRA